MNFRYFRNIFSVVVFAVAVAMVSTTHGGLVSGVTATASSMHDQPATYYGPDDAVNGYGLKGTYPNQVHGAKSPEYNSLDQWISLDPAPEWFKCDLGGLYWLDTLRFWNGSFRGGQTDAGVQQADIYYSSQATDPGSDFSNPAWTILDPVGTRVFAPHPGTGVDFAATDEIAMGGIAAQWVALDIKSNYGNEGWTMIAEVQFDGTLVPEPGTSVMLLSGLIGLTLLVWRRRKRNA